MSPIHHTVIGLPRSGKTTFLAALYHLVDAGEVESKLKIKKYLGDQSYLNQIVETWLECKEVLRTSQAGNTKVELLLEHKESGREILLGFPDLAGEAFETQIEQRRCGAEYIDGCNRSGGILLFISPDRPGDEGLTVVDQNALLGQPTVEEMVESAHGSQAWSHKMMPAQVQLVELLQFMLSPPFVKRRRRLAVVVSAWDLIMEPRPTPGDWLIREMPLLSQFLDTNIDSFETRIYGVSALGGNIHDAGQRGALMETIQSERVICVGPECRPHDLTSPIFWLTPEC